MDELELDFDRFMYERIDTLGGDTFYHRVGCYHRNRTPVQSLITNDIVAEICLDCDQQLPVQKGRH